MAVSKITVTLPSDLEAFIDARVASGRFATAGDVVREGLRLLEEREQERDAGRRQSECLRKAERLWMLIEVATHIVGSRKCFVNDNQSEIPGVP